MKFNPMKHRIPVLKRLVPSLKKRAAGLLSLNGFSLRKSKGAVFLLNTKNFVDRQIAFYDDFESAQIAYLFRAMKEHGCDIFIDVGANIGFYTVQVALAGLSSRILAFEPDPRNLLQLGANILVNRLVGKISVIGKAVSSSSGVVPFSPGADTSTGQSRIGDGGSGVTIDCVALDDVVADSGQRIFIKMDIEGHELAAISGMQSCIGRNRIFLQVESFPGNLERVQEELSRLGLRHINRIGDDHYFSNF
jgi:FkbM family methyltransferase